METCPQRDTIFNEVNYEQLQMAVDNSFDPAEETETADAIGSGRL